MALYQSIYVHIKKHHFPLFFVPPLPRSILVTCIAHSRKREGFSPRKVYTIVPGRRFLQMKRELLLVQVRNLLFFLSTARNR